MNNLIIRRAKEGELKIIQELNHQLFLHDEKCAGQFLNMNWPFEKTGEDYFRKRIEGEEGICLVAEADREIIGYLAGGIIEAPSYRTVRKMSELENMLVKEKFRGQKIGKKLFDEFVNWSKSQGMERIKVSAASDNSRAIKFYEKAGFMPYTVELEYEIK